MARFGSKHLILILFILLGVLIPTKKVSADGCPENWTAHQPPSGTSPDNVTVCTYDLIGAWVGGSGVEQVPCQGQNIVLWIDSAPNASFARIVFQEDNPPLTDQVQIGFAVVQYGNAYRPDEPELAVDVINDLGLNLWSTEIDLDNYWYEWVFGPPPDYIYFRIWYVYITTPYFGYDVSHTSIQIRPLENPYAIPFLSSFQVGAVRVSPANQQIPVPCNVAAPPPTPSPPPWPTLPPTYTPTGTFTPPTGTPTPIGGTPTVFPTSPVITPLPTTTPTPYVFSTVAAIATPTPWPTVVIPTINFPNVSLPVPDPLLPPEPADNSPAVLPGYNLTDPIEMIATQWADVINAPYQYLSITSTIGITTAAGSVAYLISPPTPIPGDFEYYAPTAVQDAVSTLGLVISLIKSVQIYFPVMWPTILAILLAFSLILFTVIARFIVSWVVIILEWIRRVWEAIPLN